MWNVRSVLKVSPPNILSWAGSKWKNRIEMSPASRFTSHLMKQPTPSWYNCFIIMCERWKHLRLTAQSKNLWPQNKGPNHKIKISENGYPAVLLCTKLSFIIFPNHFREPVDGHYPFLVLIYVIRGAYSSTSTIVFRHQPWLTRGQVSFICLGEQVSSTGNKSHLARKQIGKLPVEFDSQYIRYYRDSSPWSGGNITPQVENR